MSEWQEAGNSGDSIKWDKTGTLIGTYKRHKENVGANESHVYEIEVTDNGDTELYTVWGSSVLDNKFSEIPVGSMVKIEALGEAKSPKTGRTYNDFKVMFKPVEQSIEDIFPGSEVVG